MRAEVDALRLAVHALALAGGGYGELGNAAHLVPSAPACNAVPLGEPLETTAAVPIAALILAAVAVLASFACSSSTSSEGGDCDPISGGGCESGLSCYLVGDDPSCTSSVGAAPVNAPCGQLNACVPGNTCAVSPGGIGGCAEVCRLGEPCGAGLECRALPLAGDAETTTYGRSCMGGRVHAALRACAGLGAHAGRVQRFSAPSGTRLRRRC